MSPEQKAALEALVGRALTDDEVPAIDAHLPARDYDAVAAILNAERRRTVQPTYIGDGAVSDTMGASGPGPYAMLWMRRQALLAESLPDASLAAMTEQQRHGLALLWQAWHRLSAGTLDIGLPSVRAILPRMVGKIPGLTDAHVTALLERARVDDHVTGAQVARALEGGI